MRTRKMAVLTRSRVLVVEGSAARAVVTRVRVVAEWEPAAWTGLW